MNILGLKSAAINPVKINYAKEKGAQVGNYVREMIENNPTMRNRIYGAMKVCNSDALELAQRGDVLLINSGGSKTSMLNIPKIKDGSELIDTILKNIGINAKDGIKKHR